LHKFYLAFKLFITLSAGSGTWLAVNTCCNLNYPGRTPQKGV